MYLFYIFDIFNYFTGFLVRIENEECDWCVSGTVQVHITFPSYLRGFICMPLYVSGHRFLLSKAL